MSPALSATAQRVQNALRQLDYPCTVVEHADSTRTAEEAAQRAGCQLGQIVKSMIFRGQLTGKPILVLTSGANRVDEARLARSAGEAIGRADAAFVRETTGFAIGGVAPIAHAQPLESYMDEDLLQFGSVWAAAGTPNAIFELTPADLQKMTAASVLRIKK
jgi:prolyl-tRNA editing enzyme YbaK/EbsC (Cys-tRNA(Pro) deacylase)